MNMLASFTEKTIQSNDRWVKITLDDQGRTFTFAKGHQGMEVPYIAFTMPFDLITDWQEAAWLAERYTQA